MSRTSQIHRTTGETDVQLSLVLDGSGEGLRATGVGFFPQPDATRTVTTTAATTRLIPKRVMCARSCPRRPTHRAARNDASRQAAVATMPNE